MKGYQDSGNGVKSGTLNPDWVAGLNRIARQFKSGIGGSYPPDFPLDASFGFEHHTIRGQKEMSMRVILAFIIMLSLAVGWTKEGRPDLVKSS